MPSHLPTAVPTPSPTRDPTAEPSPSPTHVPSAEPTPSPTLLPTPNPSHAPTGCLVTAAKMHVYFLRKEVTTRRLLQSRRLLMEEVFSCGAHAVGSVTDTGVTWLLPDPT